MSRYTAAPASAEYREYQGVLAARRVLAVEKVFGA